MLMFACPMYVLSAFALTPAAIISDAYVWRASCSVIRSSFAAFHASSARFVLAAGLATLVPFSLNTRPLSRPESRCAASRALRREAMGTLRRPTALLAPRHSLGNVPRAPHVDLSSRYVDVIPTQREQLAAAQAGIQRRSRQRSIVRGGQGVE
jgi:hypothetical protein